MCSVYMYVRFEFVYCLYACMHVYVFYCSCTAQCMHWDCLYKSDCIHMYISISVHVLYSGFWWLSQHLCVLLCHPCAAPMVPLSTMHSQHKQETLQTPGEWMKPFTLDFTLAQLKALWLCGSQKRSNEPMWHRQAKRWLQLDNATSLLTVQYECTHSH